MVLFFFRRGTAQPMSLEQFGIPEKARFHPRTCMAQNPEACAYVTPPAVPPLAPQEVGVPYLVRMNGVQKEPENRQ